MSEKIYDDPEIGEVKFRKNVRSRRMSVRVHPVRGVTVTIPYYVSYKEGIGFFLRSRDFVLRTQAKQRAAYSRPGEGGAAEDGPTDKRGVILPSVDRKALLSEARQYLPGRIAELSAKYGFSFARLTLRNNRSNWGSCSSRGTVSLNIHLMQVPAHLRDYVILHELSHLRHPNHGPGFHALLEKLCEDHFTTQQPDRFPAPVSRALEKELKGYLLPM